MNNITSQQKRESVKKNYDLIAKHYSDEFGTYIEDLDVYEEFEKHLKENAKILDLGAGSGRTYSYFNERGHEYIGLDFSKEMRNYAYKLHGEFPCIVDDMVNLKKYFANNSLDAVFAVYSLFHLPIEDLKQLLSDVYDVLKNNGIFLFTYQIGKGEGMTDEPYLNENGKNVLYMSYQTNEEIESFLDSFSYTKLYRKEKVETSDSAINSNDATTAFVLVKKKTK
ncbi:MAG: class I SAM-dependent methyltransferase [Bacilli bacterium]|nr:class I SAM-dependent methyltransferase [Bacilli bacterium]